MRFLSSPWVVLWVTGSVLASACTVALEADGPVCQSWRDCARVAGEARLCSQARCLPKSAIQWGCAVDADGRHTRPVRLVISVLDEVSRPVENLELRLCTAQDLLCAQPALLTTDTQGKVVHEVTGEFAYALEVAHPSSDYVPEIHQFGPFPDGSLELPLSIKLGRWIDRSSNSTSIPDPSPDLGHVSYSLAGCPGWDASGVMYSFPNFSGTGQGPFYGPGGGSSTETGGSGRALYYNIDPRVDGLDRWLVPTRATERITGTPLAESHVVVRRGWFTIIRLSPLRNFPSP